MTKLFDPTPFSNKKEYFSCEIAATHAGFGHVQVGMATKMRVPYTFSVTRERGFLVSRYA